MDELPVAVKEIACENAMDFLTRLDPLRGDFAHGYVFRGQANSVWKLIPSILRSRTVAGTNDGLWDNETEDWGNEDHQRRLIREFKQAADEQGVFFPPGDDPSWGDTSLATAQHYGVPTNLLDWTHSPYTAAYFAGADNNEVPLDANGQAPSLAVWATAYKKSGEALNLKSELFEMNLLPDGRAWQEPFALWNIWTSFPPFKLAQNPNMRAQQGVLMVTNVAVRNLKEEQLTPRFPHRIVRSPNGPPLEERYRIKLPVSLDGMISEAIPTLAARDQDALIHNPPFIKLTLPGGCVRELLRYLDKLGFNGSTVYPGLYGAARRARERVGRDGYPRVYQSTY